MWASWGHGRLGVLGSGLCFLKRHAGWLRDWAYANSPMRLGHRTDAATVREKQRPWPICVLANLRLRLGVRLGVRPSFSKMGSRPSVFVFVLGSFVFVLGSGLRFSKTHAGTREIEGLTPCAAGALARSGTRDGSAIGLTSQRQRKVWARVRRNPGLIAERTYAHPDATLASRNCDHNCDWEKRASGTQHHESGV